MFSKLFVLLISLSCVLLVTATPGFSDSTEEFIASGELLPENRKRTSENAEPEQAESAPAATSGERSTTACLRQSAEFYRQCLATCRTVARHLPRGDEETVSQARRTYHHCRRSSCPDAAGRLYMDCVGVAL